MVSKAIKLVPDFVIISLLVQKFKGRAQMLTA